MSALPSWRNLELRHEYMMMLMEELITEDGWVSNIFADEQSINLASGDVSCLINYKYRKTGLKKDQFC